MTTLYKKVGRRYVACADYDNEVMDSLPAGHHLISVRPGAQSRRYNVDPAFAPMIAAGLYAMDAITKAIYNAQELRPRRTEMPARQRELMQALTDEFNRDDAVWLRESSFTAAQAAIDAMQAQADQLMKNESVKKAYEHFLLVAKLSGDNHE